jgi:uncharacterized membrane protein
MNLSLSPPGNAVAATRWLAAGSLLALIVLCLAWELVLAPLRPGGSWLALKALPLCIPLAGILKNRMYTYRWVSLVIWLYFIEGVVRAWGDARPGSWLAGGEIVLCLCCSRPAPCMCGCASATPGRRPRHRPRQTPPPPLHPDEPLRRRYVPPRSLIT